MLKKEKYLFRQRGGLGYFVCPPLDGVVSHGFSTKIPSSSADSMIKSIRRQTRQFCSVLQIGNPILPHLQQVHADRILVAREPVVESGEYDGAITISRQITLYVVTADCLPILIYEQNKKMVGVVHAGWRGTSLAILQKALTAAEQNFGAHPQDCLILMGPCLRPCCFEIQHDVLKILEERLPDWPQVIRVTKNRFYFDLQLANLLQARKMGVPPENIWALELCTSCQPGWFHSYRRDKDQAGRMVSVISLNQQT